MHLEPYRRVFAVRAVRQVLLLGIVLRIPLFGLNVALTLHVVTTLGRSYGQAGLVAAISTICLGISAPWRGRLLDRLGLRRVVLPSLVVTAGCYSVAPFVGYWPLLGCAGLAGLFTIPSFSIIRQAMIAVVPDEYRRTGLALDSAAVEVAFMIGPVVGVWAATTWPTRWVLLAIAMAEVAAGVVLWMVNPLLTADTGGDEAAVHVPRREWFGSAFIAICTTGAAATVVLSGTDIAIVAALRHFDSSRLIGPVLALWGLGSMVGGLVYGALHRSIPAFALLAALSLATAPIALAPGAWSLALLTLVAGVLCAPTITATVDQLSRVVPVTARGEAMGWHGTSMTTGSAIGAPLAGVAIDRWGAGSGFVTTAAVGLTVALLGWAAISRAARALPELQFAGTPGSPNGGLSLASIAGSAGDGPGRVISLDSPGGYVFSSRVHEAERGGDQPPLR